MPEPVSYEQILKELAVKRELKPWEVPLLDAKGMPTGGVAPATSPAIPSVVDPLVIASERQKIQQALAPMGAAINPETIAANQGQRSNPGLLQMLMSLMR